jgi:Asp/Glu/hydantoin racemase
VKTILVIDPVVMDAWDAQDRQEYVEYMNRVKGPKTVIKAVSITRGPVSIETFYDESFAVPEILRAIEDQGSGSDAIMVNCFADCGVRAVREITGVPVVGAAEASMALALLLGHRLAVVSTGESAGPGTELQARAMGVEGRLAAAVGITIPVLGLGADRNETARQLISAAATAEEVLASQPTTHALKRRTFRGRLWLRRLAGRSVPAYPGVPSHLSACDCLAGLADLTIEMVYRFIDDLRYR